MGLTTDTTNLLYARNELIQVGVSFTFDKVADMIYYFVKNNDVATSFSELVTSTSDNGFATTATFVPDASRLDYAYSMGNRATELTVNLADAASQNLELFQANVNLTCTAGEPTSASTVCLMRLRYTHDTTDMTYLRLRAINSYTLIEREIQDAYGCIHGIDFYTNSVTVNGEAAVGVFNMEANSAVTGVCRGVIINVYGAGLPSTTSIGLEVRSDGGAATLGEGIRVWSVGSCSLTKGIEIRGTVTAGVNYAATLTPDASRTNYAYAVGNRAAELNITMAAAASQNVEPIQMNINVIGANPTSSSTARLLRIRSTHDTTDMANLRIMNINTYMDVRKNMEAAYGLMSGVDFSVGTITVTTEAAVGVFNCDCPTGTITGKLRGIIVNMSGASLPSTSIGIEVRSDGGAATLTEGIRIWKVGSCSITTAIYVNSAVTNLYRIPAAGTAPTISGADASADVEGSIKILVGSTAKYFHYWPNAAA